jgi:hypothetical protein
MNHEIEKIEVYWIKWIPRYVISWNLFFAPVIIRTSAHALRDRLSSGFNIALITIQFLGFLVFAYYLYQMSRLTVNMRKDPKLKHMFHDEFSRQVRYKAGWHTFIALVPISILFTVASAFLDIPAISISQVYILAIVNIFLLSAYLQWRN